MSKSYDLSTNSKWASLSYGNHTVKIKAVGDGFGDSSFSDGVIVTKSIIERGTYKWIDNPAITVDDQTDLAFTSNGEPYTMVRTNVGPEGNYISYTNTDNTVTGYFAGHGWGVHSLNNGEWSAAAVEPAYQIITLENDIEVPTEFYNWAITGGNLVKCEILEAGTYKWVEEPVFPTSPILVNNIVFKYYPLNNNDIYDVLTSGSRIDIDSNRLYFGGDNGFQENGFNNGIWRTTTQNHSGDVLVYTATDTNKLRTIIVESNQTVSANFYNWAITEGNLEKTEYTATVKVNGSCDAANCPIKLYDGSDANGALLTTINENPSVGEVGTFSIKSGSLYIQARNMTGVVGAWYQVNVNNETGDAIASTTETEVVPISSNVIITFADMYCLTGDTLITLADGSSKRIDQLTLADKVLSYNPDTMLLEPDEITYTDSAEHKTHTEYKIYTFEDGTTVKTVHRHRFYNVERQAMVYMDEWKVGEHAITIDGKKIALVGHETIAEEVRHYTIFTKNQNYFANGLLSGNRYTKEMLL